MDFSERVKRYADRIRAMRPARIAPAATVRVEVPDGAWAAASDDERLARVCRAAAAALTVAPVLAGRYDGHKGLVVDERPTLWVGAEGGRSWREASAGLLDDRAARRDRLPAGGGLEVLDLSGLGVGDWRGAVVSPRVARLVVLAAALVPGPADCAAMRVFPLALDFDQRLLDARSAAHFLGALSAGLQRIGGE